MSDYDGSDYDGSDDEEVTPVDIGVIDIGQFAQRHAKVPWLVDDLIPMNSIVMWYGATSSHKSTAAFHLAECVATGKPFFGHALTPRPVVYVAAEAEDQFGPRHAAWCQHYGVDPQAVPIGLVPRSVDLAHPGQIAGLKKVTDSVDDDPAALVVIDPFSECHLGDENGSKDMRLALRGLDELRSWMLGGSVVLVHHTGKPRTPPSGRMPEVGRQSPRGHSLLMARMDSIAHVSFDKRSMAVTLNVEKMRVGPAGEKLVLPVEIVELGNGASAPVLVDGDKQGRVAAADGQPMQSATKSHEDTAIAALATFGPNGARSGEWQKASGLSAGGTWQRTLDTLKDKGLVALVGKNYVVANPS